MTDNKKVFRLAIPRAKSESGELSQSPGKFKASIPIEIGEIGLRFDSELLGELEDATAALNRFDVAAASLQGPRAEFLLRVESSASSQIEGIFTSGKELALEQLGASKEVSAQLIAANVSAMRTAQSLAGEISAEGILEVQRVLLERTNPRIAGWFREGPVWIGGRTPQLAKFVAPLPNRIPVAMADLVQFIQRIDVPRLAQVAIAHAQFETIHPFADGNGRTGRAFAHSLMNSQGLTQNSAVPISVRLAANPYAYYDALTAFREGDARPIVQIFINSSFFGISIAERLIAQIERAEKRSLSLVNSRADSVAMRLISHLPESPALNAKKVQELLKVSTPAALAGLIALEEAGVLKQSSEQRRNRIWLAPDYIKIWDHFSDIEFSMKIRAIS